jgi:DNA polymerase delta subunit 2
MMKEEKDLQLSLQGAFKVQELYTKIFEEMKKTLGVLDDLCYEIAQNVTVDVMPGENDPSDNALPQHPLNRAYFPKAFSCGHLISASNPHSFSMDETDIIGTSGKKMRI